VTLGALGLVLVSAALHATWNSLTKGSRDKVAFIWLGMTASLLLYLPYFLWLSLQGHCFTGSPVVPLISAVLQAVYSLALVLAYDVADLSVVYPLARGVAPPLIAALAVPIYRQMPSALGAAGIGLVACGIYVVHLRGWTASDLARPFRLFSDRGTRYGLLAGLAIAGYHIVDNHGTADCHPVAYLYMVQVGLSVTLGAAVMRLRGTAAVGEEFRRSWGQVVLVGALIFGAYALVLWAMKLAPVGYVAAARNVSILFGVILGSRVFGESHQAFRLSGGLAIVAGILLIAWRG